MSRAVCVCRCLLVVDRLIVFCFLFVCFLFRWFVCSFVCVVVCVTDFFFFLCSSGCFFVHLLNFKSLCSCTSILYFDISYLFFVHSLIHSFIHLLVYLLLRELAFW